MATRAQSILGPEFDHLPDDTEETLVGSSIHQGAIVGLYTSLTLCGPRRGLPWFVGNQIKLVIWRRGRKRPYQPSPDILVHPTLTSVPRTALLIDIVGPPALIIEVASPSTALESDLNLNSPDGKPGVYAEIGVAEYLVYDPTGEFIPEGIRARRLGPDGYVPWEPEANGRWVSRALGGIAFAQQGVQLRVYDQDGRLVPLSEEFADMVDAHDGQLAERDRQLAEQGREMVERDRQIAALEAELRRLREQRE